MNRNPFLLHMHFKDNGRLSREQNRFNFILSSKRIKVEHTIGLLKGRFRKGFDGS